MTDPRPAHFDPENFFHRQLQAWPMAAANFAALEGVEQRPVGSDGTMVQFNPARAASTGARTDASSISRRPCFLCAANRPPQQVAADIFPGYEFLVNPFPIFRRHFTIADRRHTPQTIVGREADMYCMALTLQGYCVFYNGPQCGASAPDHAHFQAVPAAELPYLVSGKFPFRVIQFTAPTAEEATRLIRSALGGSISEPDVNILARAISPGEVEFTVIPRRAHRPDFYGTGDGEMLISPASVDLGGVIITPRRCDFDTLDEGRLADLHRQVCFTDDPEITVGILEAPSIDVRFNGPFNRTRRADGTIIYRPENRECSFTLRDVRIGKGFHWERNEHQTFRGALTVMPLDNGSQLAINTISIEEYLKSVISSEMNADSGEEFLKAHAIVSRSWLLAMLSRRGGSDLHRRIIPAGECADCEEIVAWHDREEHRLFDVCADDHCQRYQGITRQTNPAVERAVEATRGMVLTYGGKVCDARFSKCCGGRTERFGTCWQDVDVPYLQPVNDTVEGRAKDFCDTTDPAILGQVLNSYDREHPDLYRWRVELPPDTLPELLREKTGIDFGRIKALTPLTRGESGRISRLRIDGEKRSAIIGKELEIRLALSPSCLKSSAFEVEALTDGGFRLHGRGWGHGVGLCQIGAAVMGSEGYTARQILSHYFPNTEITHLS